MGSHAGPDRSRGKLFYRGLHSDVPIFGTGEELPTKPLEDLGRPHPGYTYPDHTEIVRTSRRKMILATAGTLGLVGIASWSIISVVSSGHPAGVSRLALPAPSSSAPIVSPSDGGSQVPTVPPSPGVSLPGVPPVTISTSAPLSGPVSAPAPGPVGSPMLALDHASEPAVAPGAGTSVAAPSYFTRPPKAAPPPAPKPAPKPKPDPTPVTRPATPTPTPASQAAYSCSTRIPGSSYAKWWVAHCRPSLELAPESPSPSSS